MEESRENEVYTGIRRSRELTAGALSPHPHRSTISSFANRLSQILSPCLLSSTFPHLNSAFSVCVASSDQIIERLVFEAMSYWENENVDDLNSIMMKKKRETRDKG
ncbi:hypothetical protein QL285_015620 [Trifolium repens]|nr:hypothetical protein QL285_015620 [Trifolium repens]